MMAEEEGLSLSLSLSFLILDCSWSLKNKTPQTGKRKIYSFVKGIYMREGERERGSEERC
jgi:hypothetical protein